MSEDGWIALLRTTWERTFQELMEVHRGSKDVLAMSSDAKALARDMGYLTRDRNGNTRLSRKFFALMKGKVVL